jgi:hypothetical protein
MTQVSDVAPGPLVFQSPRYEEFFRNKFWNFILYQYCFKFSIRVDSILVYKLLSTMAKAMGSIPLIVKDFYAL